MRHRPKVYVRRPRLRVGLAPGVRGLSRATGHGAVWGHVLDELRRSDSVKLVNGGRADVWLADGHARAPEERPLVVQVHEASWQDPALRGFLSAEFTAGIAEATRNAVAAAAAVITPSRASARQVLDVYGCPPERVTAVAHGVDHRVFRPGPPGGRVPIEGPYVLFVGVLHPRKNLEAVRAAVASAAERGLPHRLVIVGNPAPDPRSEELTREANAPLPGHPGRIVHLSKILQRDLAALMAGTGVFCLPSHFEGFGLPALEAMACGAPVVVSDRGALPEVVGDGGLVVSPEGEAVSEAVGRVLSDPALAGRLRAAALRQAGEFSWARTAAGWLAVLQRIAEGR